MPVEGAGTFRRSQDLERRLAAEPGAGGHAGEVVAERIVNAVGDADMPREDSPVRLFLAGMAVTLGNPKIMIFYLALLPTIIDLGAVTLLGWAELTLTMAVVLIAIDLAWVLAAAQARKLLRSKRAMLIANRVSAATMGGAAAAIAARS